MDLEEFELQVDYGTTGVPKADSAVDGLREVDRWFSAVCKKARWMDIVGDFAGNELFVLDGDAVIQTVLDDHLVALGRPSDPSFQIVHARWCVEKLLKNLLDRNANFEVVFWEENRHVTTHTGSDRYEVVSRSLARQVLFQHIMSLDISVRVFSGLSDAGWTDYVHRSRPMFVMTNDGGSAESKRDGDLQAERVLLQRMFLYRILADGLAIALLDNIEFRDAKILVFIVEDQRRSDGQNLFPRSIFLMRENALVSLDSAESDGRQVSPPKLYVENGMSQSAPLSDCLNSFCERLLANSVIEADDLALWLLRVFISHFFILQRLSIAQRAQILPKVNQRLLNFLLKSFLPAAFESLSGVLTSRVWNVDIDIRIFINILHVQSLNPEAPFSAIVGGEIALLTEEIFNRRAHGSTELSSLLTEFSVPEEVGERGGQTPVQPRINVLPFQHDVLDVELRLVHVEVADTEEPALPKGYFDYGEAAAFVDDRHWHRDRKLLPKHLGGEDAKPVDERARHKAMRRHQRFMAQMQGHAETLMGALGVPLEQKIIVSVGHGSSKAKKDSVLPDTRRLHAPEPKRAGKKGKEPVVTKKQQMLQDIKTKKQADEDDKSAKWWPEQLATLGSDSSDLQTLAFRVSKLSESPRTKTGWLALEYRLFCIHLELKRWINDDEKETNHVRDAYIVTIMRMVKDLYERRRLSKTVLSHLESILTALGFADYIQSLSSSITLDDTLDRKLSFEFTKLAKSKSGSLLHKFMQITEHPITWQLRLFGEFMDRSMDSQPDARVDFCPDGWQRKVLDALDAERSVLVVAPTSAGKTFISFYAMEKVLRESDDGILVYIAPTKALVNQVAAEIYARFRKEMDGTSCWAIHTRDYRINDPQKCQILVTVPEMFAIMLLSPPLARKWTPRIRRIILDEIHTIGQQEGGAVWEQILLLAPCPIIGLSATIGQPEVFNKWLSSVQEAHGYQHELISHPHRYSHLRKFIYVQPDRPMQFSGLDLSQPSQRLCFIHPATALAFGTPALPPDLSFEARDALGLYLSLSKLQPDLPFDVSSLDPLMFFASRGFLKQKDVLEYEAKLKEHLVGIMATRSSDTDSLFQKAIAPLEDPHLATVSRQKLFAAPSPQAFLGGLMGLLAELNCRNYLPALLFAFDRSNCEIMAKSLLETLQSEEDHWRKHNVDWVKRLQKWNDWKIRQQNQQRLQEKSKIKRVTTDDLQDRQEASSSWESSFDPADPSPQFSFADTRKYSKGKLDEAISDLKWTSTPAWAYGALKRGIAVHHSGMNKQYRSLVESLFRLGYVRVVICTGTLALGINAPTKTSVFCGDSPFLTALMYRQCAGRAGRRGYDLLGNVVFYGLPMDRIQRLILSRLPSLTGNFPLTSTLCLRLMNLLNKSISSRDSAPEFAIKAIQSIMNLPHISFGSDTGREQLLHHLRFSIDYLRRAGLLDVNGRPMNLYAVAAHLYHTEPSNFALITLMRSGVLHTVCGQSSIIQAKKDLMVVLCHLFGRRYLHKAYASVKNLKEIRQAYPSRVVLPPLPRNAREVLLMHNDEILRVFQAYATLYSTQYTSSLGEDNILPLSCAKVGGTGTTGTRSLLETYLDRKRIDVHTRSLFVANSGHSDEVKTVEELTRTSRRGLQLNEHAIPSLSRITMDPSSREDSPKLNGYLFDYYTHGQVDTLVIANGIRRGDVWYALEDFNLTLKTIRTALQQLLLKAGSKDASAEVSPDGDWGGDVEADSGYGTGSAIGSVSFDETDSDPSAFARPPMVSDADWKVYQVLDSLTEEFEVLFKKMWA